MPGRTFTVEEATATLPYVSRVATDVVRVYRRMRRRVALFRRLKRNGIPETRLDGIRSRIERLGRVLLDLQRELEPIGCQIKDYDRGVIDFPALREGRAVELCWKLGERAVSHWHEVGAGFFARQPLEPAPAAP